MVKERAACPRFYKALCHGRFVERPVEEENDLTTTMMIDFNISRLRGFPVSAKEVQGKFIRTADDRYSI
jgi:hypothetical protein